MENLRDKIAATLAPAIDCKAPYAKVMITKIAEIAADEAKLHIAEIVRLRVWIADLQSGLYVNCVYCGHRYGPGETTPVSMADALKAHISQCPEHPLSVLVTAARSAATACGNVIYNGKQRPCEHKFHMTAWERVKDILDNAIERAGAVP